MLKSGDLVQLATRAVAYESIKKFNMGIRCCTIDSHEVVFYLYDCPKSGIAVLYKGKLLIIGYLIHDDVVISKISDCLDLP